MLGSVGPCWALLGGSEKKKPFVAINSQEMTYYCTLPFIHVWCTLFPPLFTTALYVLLLFKSTSRVDYVHIFVARLGGGSQYPIHIQVR